MEYGVFDENQNIQKTFGAIQDITEYKEAVANQKSSEERFTTLFEEAPVGIQEEDYSAIKKALDKLSFRGITDYKEYLIENPQFLKALVCETSITEVNQELLRIHEAESRDEFLQDEADIDEWWDVEWLHFYAAEINALYRGDQFYESERVDTKINGDYMETRSITTVVKGYEDSWKRVITIHEDITDRKKNEAAIIEAKTQAEKANQAKSDFLSSMSHELRTPLNAIIGFSQLSEYDKSLSESQLSNSREINRAGKHLLNLVDQILDLSKIEAGEYAVTRESVDLSSILEECVTWVKSVADSHMITITFDPGLFGSVAVLADAIRIKQVFLNLLTNAIKYNSRNGHVFVVSKIERDGYLKVGIKDTGKGISSNNISRLFQPFDRLGAESSTIEGTGIGLVITRQLVESMNGKIEVESEEGRGSVFWVEFEIDPTKQTDIEEGILTGSEINDSAVDYVLKGPKILVAEDNLVNQELMRAQLTLLDYSADFAENGVKALEKWESSDYDILLTDIRMPEMDGFELVEAIRDKTSGGEYEPLIVAISANAMEEDIKKCNQVGVDEVIPKPVELDKLKECLKCWQPREIANEPDEEIVDTPVIDEALVPSYASAIDVSVLISSVGDNKDVHQQLLQSFVATLPNSIF